MVFILTAFLGFVGCVVSAVFIIVGIQGLDTEPKDARDAIIIGAIILVVSLSLSITILIYLNQKEKEDIET
jgi:hypothetical protein